MEKKKHREKVGQNCGILGNRSLIAAALVALCILPMAFSQSEYAEQPDGSSAGGTYHLSYPFGYRRLSSQWANARNQVTFGIMDLSIQPRSWPLSVVTRTTIAYSGAIPAGADPQATFSGAWDFDLGLRRTLNLHGRVLPFVGGGLAVVGASTTVQINTPYGAVYDQNWSSTTIGPFVDAGFYLPLRSNWHTGILLTYTRGKGNLNNQGIEMGGLQAAFLIGKTWGARHRHLSPPQ